MIDLDLLVDLMQPMHSKLNTVNKPSDVILFLGNTGAGKSTVINYLLGYELKRIRGGHAGSKNPNSRPFAEMGNSVESITMFPSLYLSDNGFNLCDCPGFYDNRGKEYCVATTLGLQTYVEKFKTITGIALLIDSRTLFTERAKDLRRTILALKLLMANNSNTSVMFILNNRSGDDIDKDDVLKKIKETIAAEQEIIQKYSASNNSLFLSDESNIIKEKQEAKQIISILETINNKNLIMLDVFDNGKSRQEFFDFASYCKPQLSSLLDFTLADDNCRMFKNYIINEIALYRQLDLQIEQLATQNKRCLEKIEKFQSIRKQYQDKLGYLNTLNIQESKLEVGDENYLIQSLENNSTKDSTDPEFSRLSLIVLVARYLYSEKALFNIRLNENITQLNSIKKMLNSYKSSLKRLDTIEPTHAKWLEPTSTETGIFGRKISHYSYNGDPFIYVKEHIVFGELTRIHESPSSGIFRAKFKGDVIGTNIVDLCMYIENRVQNKDEIKRLKSFISSDELAEKNVSNDIVKLEGGIKELSDRIKMKIQEYYEFVREKTSSIALLNKKNDDILKDLIREEKQIQIDLNMIFNNKCPLLSNIQKLASIRPFITTLHKNNTELIDSFLQIADREAKKEISFSVKFSKATKS